jgi:hypothetical protein
MRKGVKPQVKYVNAGTGKALADSKKEENVNKSTGQI